MALPLQPNRGSISASSINIAMGVSSTSKFSFSYTSFRNLTQVTSPDIQISDAYGKPIPNNPSFNYSIVVNPISTISFNTSNVSGISYFRYMVFSYTNGIIGAILSDSGEISNTSYTTTALPSSQRVLCWIVGFYGNSYMTGSKDTTVEVRTPPSASFVVQNYPTYIDYSVDPVLIPITSRPDYFYFAIYSYVGAFTLIEDSIIYTSTFLTYRFVNLKPNYRYYVYASISNPAGDASNGQIVWTKSTTVTTVPGNFGNITLTGTSSNRGINWDKPVGAVLYDVYVWEYVGGASPFGTTYYYGTIFTNSVTGITGIPAGKNIYIYISAQNWVGSTVSSLQTTN